MHPLDALRQPIAKELERYTALFDEVLTHEETFMRQVLAYVAQRKGKMMRPILVLLLARELGEVTQATLHSAVALELLHTSSLIHDDVVDESNERRGMKSLHQVYDNKVAVLLGDYLLAQTLAQSALTGDVHIVEAVARLGGNLAEGEILQLSHVQEENYSEEVYYRIIRRKTATLFETCGRVAALSMGAPAEVVERFARLGDLIGICFQIRDDIFDYFDDPAIGKPRGNDLQEGKLTLPLIYALTHSQNQEAHERALRVKRGEATADDVTALIAFAKERGGIAYAETRMEELRQEALQLLDGFTSEAVRTALQQYIDFVMGRKN